MIILTGFGKVYEQELERIYQGIMFRLKIYRLFVLLLFILLPVIFFRNYFTKNQVPFPANLLVSFYSPWKFETFKGYEGGIPNKPIGFDNIKIFYPHLKLTIDELKKGNIPYWNPYVFSGNVHLGLFQTAVFYPLNLIYLLLPMIDAWSVLIIIQPLLACLFMYLFLRTQRLSRGASVFGSLAFAYSGWMIAWWEESLVIEHSVLWLPLALFASSKLWESGWKLPSGFVLLFSLIVSILAGFFQTTIYVFVTVLVWNIYMWRQVAHRNRNGTIKMWLIFGTCIAAIGATALQWLPAAQSYIASPRLTADARYLYDSYLMPLRHLVTFIAPDFWGNPGTYNYFFPKAFYHEKVIYMGIVPLIFLLVAYMRKTGIQARFWKIFSLITLSLGFQLPTSWIWYTLHIPILSSAQPSRIFVLSTLGFSVLSAYGLDYCITRKDRNSVFKGISVIALVLFFLWVFVLANRYYFTACSQAGYVFCNTLSSVRSFFDTPYMTVSLRNLIIPTLLAALSGLFVFFAYTHRRVMFLGVIVLSIVSSLYFAQKYIYFSDRRFVFPETRLLTELKARAGYNRVWSYGNAYIEKNFLAYYGLYSPEGYDPLFSQVYGELLNTVRTHGVVTEGINRADVDLSPAGEDTVLSADTFRFTLLHLLGVRYIVETKQGEKKDILTADKRFPASDFSLAWEDDHFRIWESLHAVPRTFFTSHYIVRTSKQDVINAIFDSQTALSKTIILEKDPFPVNTQVNSYSKGSVSIKSYQPSQVILESQSDGGGLVFLSDTYDSGWKAYVDGVETPIMKADYAFRAIAVPKGEHRISLSYQPFYVTLSVMTQFIALGLFIIISLAGAKMDSIKNKKV